MDRLWARVERMKHQIPNTKLQRNPKLQIPKPVASSLPWSLGLGASLVFGVWCLVFAASICGRILPAPSSRCAAREGEEPAPPTSSVLSSIPRTERIDHYAWTPPPFSPKQWSEL